MKLDGGTDCVGGPPWDLFLTCTLVWPPFPLFLYCCLHSVWQSPTPLREFQLCMDLLFTPSACMSQGLDPQGCHPVIGCDILWAKQQYWWRCKFTTPGALLPCHCLVPGLYSFPLGNVPTSGTTVVPAASSALWTALNIS